MRNRNILTSPDAQPRLAGRQLAILALGAFGFRYEQGPYRHTSEALQASSEEPVTEATERLSVE